MTVVHYAKQQAISRMERLEAAAKIVGVDEVLKARVQLIMAVTVEALQKATMMSSA